MYKIKLFLAVSILAFYNVNCLASKITVSVTAPDGSASKSVGTKILKSMLFTPCLKATDAPKTYGNEYPVSVTETRDYFAIQLTGENTDGSNLYFFIVNNGASGNDITTNNNQFYVFSRYKPFDQFSPSYDPNLRGVQIIRRAASKYLNSSEALLRPDDMLTTKINETILQGSISFDGGVIPLGLWTVTAILANPATVNFDEPTTWSAWDAVQIVFGIPWSTNTNATCG